MSRDREPIPACVQCGKPANLVRDAPGIVGAGSWCSTECVAASEVRSALAGVMSPGEAMRIAAHIPVRDYRWIETMFRNDVKIADLVGDVPWSLIKECLANDPKPYYSRASVVTVRGEMWIRAMAKKNGFRWAQ